MIVEKMLQKFASHILKFYDLTRNYLTILPGTMEIMAAATSPALAS